MSSLIYTDHANKSSFPRESQALLHSWETTSFIFYDINEIFGQNFSKCSIKFMYSQVCNYQYYLLGKSKNLSSKVFEIVPRLTLKDPFYQQAFLLESSNLPKK